MGASLLAVLVVSVLLAAVARRYDVSAPLALVVAGLVAGLIPGFARIELEPRAGAVRASCRRCCGRRAWRAATSTCARTSRPIGLLAVGLPLATTFAVGFVAYHTVPELTVAAALVLGAIVAPPDAVSATAIGRRLGLPRQIMTLLGGESLLNDATALTAYKVVAGGGDRDGRELGHAAWARSRWRLSAVSSVGVVLGIVDRRSSGRGSTIRWSRARSVWWRRSSSTCSPRRCTAPA